MKLCIVFLLVVILQNSQSNALELKPAFVTGSMMKNGIRLPDASFYQAKFMNLNIPDNSTITIDTSGNSRTNSEVNLVWLNKGIVKMIPSLIFQVFSNLQYVAVDNAAMEEIRPEFFANATYLKVLVVSRNLITNLGPRIFEGAKNLEFINFEMNKITSIDSTIFADLKDLKGISLDGNQLKVLDENTFGSLPNIQIMCLQSNKIESLHYGTFAGLTNLQELDLTNNKCINKIFTRLKGNLKHLDMELFTLCHDSFLMKDLEELGKFPAKADQSVQNMSRLITKVQSQIDSSRMEMIRLEIQPMSDTLLEMNGQVKNLTAVNEKALNYEKLINITLTDWKISTYNLYNQKKLNLTEALRNTKEKTAENTQIFQKKLEASKKIEDNKTDALMVAFAELKKDYQVIQNKSNTEMKSLRTCVIILFVIIVGGMVFVWKKILPTNYYRKDEETVSSL